MAWFKILQCRSGPSAPALVSILTLLSLGSASCAAIDDIKRERLSAMDATAARAFPIFTGNAQAGCEAKIEGEWPGSKRLGNFRPLPAAIADYYQGGPLFWADRYGGVRNLAVFGAAYEAAGGKREAYTCAYVLKEDRLIFLDVQDLRRYRPQPRVIVYST